jgi:hypothetical protein
MQRREPEQSSWILRTPKLYLYVMVRTENETLKGLLLQMLINWPRRTANLEVPIENRESCS